MFQICIGIGYFPTDKENSVKLDVKEFFDNLIKVFLKEYYHNVENYGRAIRDCKDSIKNNPKFIKP